MMKHTYSSGTLSRTQAFEWLRPFREGRESVEEDERPGRPQTFLTAKSIEKVSVFGFQECDEEDVETWVACDAEDCRFQMLNDDEIVTSVQEESYPVNDETNEDEESNSNECSKCPSNNDVFSALETAMEWYEQQSECCPTQLLLIKRIRDLSAKKRCTIVQRKISDYSLQ
ncbi:uncharacterized protein TNCV_1340231 [Trichonephila clavipes]|uniref:Uncharacterized protein n=1 Tax=Trichonephila clavipes TaxID=2585209 RepID=A0A8X6V148_TRICX|nr:uncharacterized protein TNCV_1340231 [Trichonephila clavipes]